MGRSRARWVASICGWALAAATLLGGCGGEGGDAPGYVDPSGKSGTRLRRRYFEAGPGAYKTVDFWDTELETACSFRMAVDGAMRCLPTVYGEVYYSDAGCTQPIYEAPAGLTSCQDTWGYDNDTDAFFRVTSTPAVLTGGTLYYSYGSMCSPSSSLAGREYWVAEHVTSASFVRGTRVDEARTGGMVARFVDGDDGSRELVETVHGTRGYTCTFDDDGTCAPNLTTYIRYTDALCSDPFIEVQSTALPPLLPVFAVDSNLCRTGVTYYERGATLTPASLYYRNANGVCTLGAPGVYNTYYEMGAEIPLTSLPHATLLTEGTGALQARRYVDDDGAPLGAAHIFWDTTEDEECEPGQVEATGDYACLTMNRGIATGFEFADAACSSTMPIGEAYCVATAPRLMYDYAVLQCAEVADVRGIPAVYETGAAFGPDYYFENDYVTCEMRTFSGSTTGYRLGPDATSTLPPLTLAME